MPETHARKRILVIEDEKPLSNALNLKLTAEGYDVTVAEDGEKGLEHAQQENFDLILLDIIMPKLNGFSLLELLKKAGSSQTIIVLSNLGQEEEIKRARDLGAEDYMVKANSPIIKIIEKVNSVLGNC